MSTTPLGASRPHTERSSSDPRGIVPAGGGPLNVGTFDTGGAAPWDIPLNGRGGAPGCTGPNPACITEAEKAEREEDESMSTMIRRIR